MPPREKARALVYSQRGRLEFLHLQRTKRLARPMMEYDALTLNALLLHEKATLQEIDAVQIALDAGRDPVFRWYPRPQGDYDGPPMTDDPVINEWERVIAEGKIPDDWIGKEKLDG